MPLSTHTFPERGSVVILMAILLAVLIAFAALSVDVSSVSTSQEQAQHNAQLVVLSALEQYFRTVGDHETKLTAALARARDVAAFNLTFHLVDPHAKSLASDRSDGSVPYLEPGRYHFDLPNSGENPCAHGAHPPCFVPLGPGEMPNAFRISGNLYKDQREMFSGVFSADREAPIPVKAIATVVPRRGVFVVDISGSLVHETHPKGVNRYAYHTVQDAAEWATHKSSHPYRHTKTSPDLHPASDYVDVTTLGDADYGSDPMFAKVHPSPTSIPGDVQSGPMYSTSAETYKVDVWRFGRAAEGGYEGPQPLTAIIQGIHTAAQMFEKRAVAGDKVGLVFYDTRVTWPRVVKLTDEFDYVKRLTDLGEVVEEYQFVPTPSSALMNSLRYGLFPRSGSFTNTILGLTEAAKMFTGPGSRAVPTSDFVVLIGDGMSNCAPCEWNPAVYTPRYDIGPNGTPDGSVDHQDYTLANECIGKPLSGECSRADVDGDGGVTPHDGELIYWAHTGNPSPHAALWDTGWSCQTACNDVFPLYEVSVQWQAVQMAAQFFYPSKIPLHIILAGAHVGPHTVDVYNPETNRCWTDRELRGRTTGSPIKYVTEVDMNGESGSRDGPGRTWNDMWGNASRENPFFWPNTDWYRIAKLTGGLWAPLRPRDDTECAGFPGRIPLDGTPLCKTTETDFNPANRRLTDPYCRTYEEQITDSLEEIMKTNPYTIVYEGP